MGDEFFAGKAGPAVTSAAAAAAANAASAGRGANPLPGIPPQMPFEPFDMNDAHPMKVPVPSDGRGKKGGGRGGGGRTPHRKAAPQPPPPPSFQQAEWDASAFQQAIPPAYGIPAAAGMAYPPAPAAGMAAPYPVPCPPMPGPMQMYGMTGMMPFMYPPIAYPHMPSSSPPQPPEKTKKTGKNQQNAQSAPTGKEGKKRRGKAKSKEPSTPEANPDCSDELLSVRNAQSNGLKAKLSFQEVLPHLLEFAQDQHGSRFLQGKLDEASPEERQEAFAVICADDASPDAVSLAKDVSGNFVVQKLFDIGTQEQKKKLAERLQPEVASLSKDNYGCRVVQKAIGAVSKDLQVMLASSLQSNVTECITNMHGNFGSSRTHFGHQHSLPDMGGDGGFGKGGFGDKGKGKGKKGKGKGKGKQEEKQWTPMTKLGRLVNDGKITCLEDIYLHSLPIKEPEIIDHFYPPGSLKDEVLKIHPVQKMTSAGQTNRFVCYVLVGDTNGHIGLGSKCAKEVATAIRGGIIAAKINLIPVRRGFWGNRIGLPHTVPMKVHGKCGSVRARLIPAPRGSGIVGSPVMKKMMAFAGISDCFTCSCGHTRTTANFAKATFEALKATYGYLTPDLWKPTNHVKSPFQEWSDYLAQSKQAATY